MKKYVLTVVTKNGQTKRVSVYLQEEMAILLEQCDEKTRRIYLEEEYKAACIERKETRRHLSLEDSIAKGFDYVLDGLTAEEKLILQEEVKDLEQAMRCLTDKQRVIVKLHVVKGKSFREIAKILDCRWDSARDIYNVAIEKIKKQNIF